MADVAFNMASKSRGVCVAECRVDAQMGDEQWLDEREVHVLTMGRTLLESGEGAEQGTSEE